MKKHERCDQLLKQKLSYKEIQQILGAEYGDYNYNVRERAYRLRKRADGNGYPKLIWSDPHIPFNHPRYLEFLKDVYKQYKCKDSICLGDLFDNHAISRHQTEPDAIDALREYEAAVAEGKKFSEAFPYTKFVPGNHCKIYLRQAASIGMPSVFLKDYHTLWDLPNTWIIKNAFYIDDVVYKHGEGCGGKDGAINAAIQERASTVIGHQHSFGGCKYIANHRDIIFGMNVGCGIDIEAYAFAYGKHAKYRPTLGCGVVFSNEFAIFVPMNMHTYAREE